MAENGTQQAQGGTKIDPFRGYAWTVEIGQVTEGHFVECSELQATVEVIKYREGGNNQIIRNLPGQVDYGSLTLRYGVTTSHDLWDWFQSIVRGNVERRNISVVHQTTVGEEALRWNLFDAWPKAWRGAKLNALAKEAAIAEICFVFDSLELG